MKLKTILILLLLIPFVFADTREEDFDIPIKVEIKNWYVNVTAGDGRGYYSCNSTSTNTFNPTIYHNFTYECEEELVIHNFTSSVDKMADTCKVIQDAYKDSSTYYKQYVDCKSSLSTCEEAKTNFQKDANLKASAVSEKEVCNRKLTEMEREKNEFQVMSNQFNSSLNVCEIKSLGYAGSRFWIGAICLLAGGVGYHFYREKKTPKSPTDKEFPK